MPLLHETYARACLSRERVICALLHEEVNAFCKECGREVTRNDDFITAHEIYIIFNNATETLKFRYPHHVYVVRSQYVNTNSIRTYMILLYKGRFTSI